MSKTLDNHPTLNSAGYFVDEFEQRHADAEAKRDTQMQSNAEQAKDAANARARFVSTWSETLRQFIDSALVDTQTGKDAPSFGPRGSETHPPPGNVRVETFRYVRTGNRLTLEVDAAIDVRTEYNFVGASHASPPDVQPPPQSIVNEIKIRQKAPGVLRTWAALRLNAKDRNVPDDAGASDWFLYSFDHGKPYPNVETHKLKQAIVTLIDLIGGRPKSH